MSPYRGSQHHSSLLVQGDTHRPWLTLTAAPQPLKGAWSKHCKYNTLHSHQDSTSCSRVAIFNISSPAPMQFAPPKSKVFSPEKKSPQPLVWNDHISHPGGEYFIVLKHTPPSTLSVWKITVTFHLAPAILELRSRLEVNTLVMKMKPSTLNYVALILPSSSMCQTKQRLNTNVKENCEEREEPEDSVNQMV